MDVHGRDLRYFVAVAEELHFTRAAERLYLSQPALSKQVRALERQLGLTLFERDRREVQLTDAGEILLRHARTLLGVWDSATAELERLKAAQSATLTIGMSTSLGRGGLLPAIRSRFSDLLPDVTLILRQISWGDPTGGLADRSTDVAFVWLPLPDADKYDVIVVAEEQRMVAMAEDHPLATHADITVADLVDERFLALPKTAGVLRDHWLLADAGLDRPPAVGAIVHTVEETYEALVDHRGIVVLAAGNSPNIVREGVVTRPLTGIAPSRLALACRRDNREPASRLYMSACSQAVAAPLAPRSAGTP